MEEEGRTRPHTHQHHTQPFTLPPFPPPPPAAATHVAVEEGQGRVGSDELVLLFLGQVRHGDDGACLEEEGAWEEE